jgi:chaperonin GroES
MKLSILTIVLGASSCSAFTTTTAGPSFARRSSQLSVKVDGRTIEGAVKPTNNFLLVKTMEAKDKTEGGILLTGKAKIVKTEGTVVAVGPGMSHPESGEIIPIPVNEGEGVVYGKYDGTEVDIDGAKHTLIRDTDILLSYKGDELKLENAEVINDNVLVYVETKETATEGGILIASTAKGKAKPSTGKVVKVGPGRRARNGSLMDMEVAEGDFVKFRDFAGNEVEIEGKEYSVVRMSDVLAKF